MAEREEVRRRRDEGQEEEDLGICLVQGFVLEVEGANQFILFYSQILAPITFRLFYE